MKATKIIGKIILVIFILIILFVTNASILSNVPFGITLPQYWGWSGECYGYEDFGFPFSVHSYPEPGLWCACAFNIIAFVLNFILLIILTGTLYLIFRKRIIKKQIIKLILFAIACGTLAYYVSINLLGYPGYY